MIGRRFAFFRGSHGSQSQSRLKLSKRKPGARIGAAALRLISVLANVDGIDRMDFPQSQSLEVGVFGDGIETRLTATRAGYVTAVKEQLT